MPLIQFLRRMVRPLASRKLRVALVTVIAAFAAEWGIDVHGELILTILGTGVALILGIAHEDRGRHAAAGTTDAKFAPAAPSAPASGTRAAPGSTASVASRAG